jgi:hypothetical protein
MIVVLAWITLAAFIWCLVLLAVRADRQMVGRPGGRADRRRLPRRERRLGGGKEPVTHAPGGSRRGIAMTAGLSDRRPATNRRQPWLGSRDEHSGRPRRAGGSREAGHDSGD